MHRTSGRWKLGLALALLTALFWGVLPIALKVTLRGMDPYTITWYRFAVAAAVLGAILAASGGLPRPGALERRHWLMFGVALLGLAGNYLLYLIGLSHATPTVTQTVIQLSPVFLLLGGLLLFKERFSGLQWLGFAALLAGLLLFFNDRLPELANLRGGLGLGVTLLVLAAALVSVYGLTQKQLLKRLNSQQILLLLYIGAAIVLLPLARPASVRALDHLQLWLLMFCCANTLIGYGAFAEALEHWEVSRVAAVLTLAPLFTMSGMWLVRRLAPGFIGAEGLNGLSVVGALLVIGGAALCALGKMDQEPEVVNGPLTS